MKKKALIGITTGLCCLSAITACQRQSALHEVREWETIKAEHSQTLCADEGAPSAHVYVEMDYLTADDSVCRETNRLVMKKMYGLRTLLAPKAAADSFAADYLKRYHTELQGLYNQEKKSEVSRGWYDYKRQIKAKNISHTSGLIQYQIDQLYHEGGNHVYQETSFLNFDPQNGNLLTLDSLFKKGTRIELETIMLQQLEEQKEAASIDELREMGFLKLTGLYATQNFLLEEKGIRFHYQPDELASFENGATVIFIPYKKIKSILTEKFIDLWNRF